MRKASLLALTMLLLLAFGATAQQASTEQTGTAKLHVPEVSFDFGYIPQVGKVGHAYKLYNVGDGDLRILRVKPGCGCTKAPLEKDVVGPGDSTSVELIFTSKEIYKGSMRKSAAVTTNDNTYGTLRLRFEATINEQPDSVEPVRLSPWDIKFNPSERNQTMEVAVKNVVDKPLDLKLVSYPHKFLTIDFPEGKLEPDETKTITVAIRDDIEDEAFEKSFTFETGDVKNTRFTVPVVLMPSLTKVENQ